MIETIIAGLPGTLAQGIIYGIMALGVYITFKLLNFADLSVDGSFSTGGIVAAMVILSGKSWVLALVLAFIAGAAAGLITGVLHTTFGIPDILAGILTQLALYSINLRISNAQSSVPISVDKYDLAVSLRYQNDALITVAIIAVAIIAVMYAFFGTEMGSALRATGTNPAMAKAQGININIMKTIGLVISNALVAFAGALYAQFNGQANVNNGRGAIVIGLAAIIIGEVICNVIFRKKINFAILLVFVVLGGVLYYIFMDLVLKLKLNTNDLKLFTALIVAIFLAVPYLKGKANSSFRKAAREGGRRHA
ncbi:ABC transporter permease [Pseudobutyrivibrio sp.]|uniref:ABC transporter permease n=1 Tax=Pseudobutyrivibrio sp. TaxID=2014367 RepID=UPI001D99EA2E|nr:ABC transporter permease [Pseudobutyrivibrio sp.]MBE5911625.1 ABC transporter permease [Pseudobutyrivibrio sp.]